MIFKSWTAFVDTNKTCLGLDSCIIIVITSALANKTYKDERKLQVVFLRKEVLQVENCGSLFHDVY